MVVMIDGGLVDLRGWRDVLRFGMMRFVLG